MASAPAVLVCPLIAPSMVVVATGKSPSPTMVRINVLPVIPTSLFFDPALPWTPSRSTSPADLSSGAHPDAPRSGPTRTSRPGRDLRFTGAGGGGSQLPQFMHPP